MTQAIPTIARAIVEIVISVAILVLTFFSALMIGRWL